MSAPVDPVGTATPSLILALHRRYEQAWGEYNEIDARKLLFKPEASDSDRSRAYIACERGMNENFQETALIRNTICYQTPTTHEEMAILIQHVWVMIDECSGVALEDLSLEERQALEQAINSVFSYLITGGYVDPERIGRQFSRHAKLAYNRHRNRTGLTPAD